MSHILKGTKRTAAIKYSSWIGIIGNGILATLKIGVGIISGSAAVIADGIDSASDIIGSLITLYAANVSDNPPDRHHPWGKKRIEAIATKVLSIFILFAGLQLVIGTAGMFFSDETRELPGKSAIIVTIISIFAKSAIAFYKFHIAKITNSLMVKADAINMKNDIFLSLAVLIGLGITYYTNLPIVDPIIGCLLGFWIIYNGAILSLETNAELLDSMKGNEEIYDDFFAAVEETPGVFNPHKVRIRRLNDLYDIIVDIEVDGNITVSEGHERTKLLEQNIKKRIPGVFDILIHVEPIGNIQEEQFGLTPRDFE